MYIAEDRMTSRDDVRFLFILPCGLAVTGKPQEAKSDMCLHRENCSTCRAVSYVNTVDLFDRRRVRRELVIPKEDASITTTLCVLHEGIIPPKSIVDMMIYDRLQNDPKDPGFKLLPMW